MFRFPWTNEHELNLSWIIRQVKDLLRRVKNIEDSGGGGGAPLSNATPQPLGTAVPGTSAECSRADHVHAKPTASDVGAIAAPVSPTSGQYLQWNGIAWVAASLPVYNGG